MRTFPAALNRTLLIAMGLVLLAGGLWAVWPWAQATAGWTTPAGATGLVADPEAGVAPGAAGALEQPWLPAAVIGAGVVLVFLGLAWLGRQVPRTGRAGPLRFTEDPGAGSTTMEPKVLEAAASDAAAALPGVDAARAVLRGSIGAPVLVLHVHAEPNTRLADLTEKLTAGVASDVVRCLGTPLRHLAIEYSVAKK
ncbi:Asp23/Gls24 family envelope stress response protein [Arthrobacter halodurans]|uniref:Alkaline shock response membrane anchor protein AmaP n=1 Tax=Arthrobacter halodurans TaxID=516699 RepID=A0ABV4UQN1_9MICC